MENFPDKDISAILESIIADKNATPEKQKWAEYDTPFFLTTGIGY